MPSIPDEAPPAYSEIAPINPAPRRPVAATAPATAPAVTPAVAPATAPAVARPVAPAIVPAVAPPAQPVNSVPSPGPDDAVIAAYRVNLRSDYEISPNEFQRPAADLVYRPHYAVLVGSSVGVTHHRKTARDALYLVPDGVIKRFFTWISAAEYYRQQYREDKVRLRYRGNCTLSPPSRATPPPQAAPPPPDAPVMGPRTKPVYHWVSSSPGPFVTQQAGSSTRQSATTHAINHGADTRVRRRIPKNQAPTTPTPGQTRRFLMDTTPSPEGPISSTSTFTLVPSSLKAAKVTRRRKSRSPSLEILRSPHPAPKRATPPLYDLTLISSANNSDNGDALTVITISDDSEVPAPMEEVPFPENVADDVRTAWAFRGASAPPKLERRAFERIGKGKGKATAKSTAVKRRTDQDPSKAGTSKSARLV